VAQKHQKQDSIVMSCWRVGRVGGRQSDRGKCEGREGEGNIEGDASSVLSGYVGVFGREETFQGGGKW